MTDEKLKIFRNAQDIKLFYHLSQLYYKSLHLIHYMKCVTFSNLKMIRPHIFYTRMIMNHSKL